jgi:hypothetical protein
MLETYDAALVTTDEHIPYMNPVMERIAIGYLERRKPEKHILLGDLFDNPGMSSFDPDPNHNRDTQTEIDWAVQYLNRLHAASPDTKRVLLFGNHDWGRLERTRSATPYGLKNLRNLELSSLIRESSQHQGLPIGDVEFLKEYILAGQVLFVHGDPRLDARIKGGVTGLRRTAEEHPWNGEIVIGHGHQAKESRSRFRNRSAYMVGAMLDPKEVHYNAHSQYENGLMVVHYKPNVRPRPEVHIANYRLSNGKIVIDGVVFDGRLPNPSV